MQIIDRQFMETPVFGVRQMTWHLRNAGHAVNPKRARRLMRLMALMPIYQKPAKGRRPFPYLLRGLAIDRPIPASGALTSGISRCGKASSTSWPSWTGKAAACCPGGCRTRWLEAEFCADALEEAIARFGPPEIMNTDQGSQFTAFA